MPDTPASTDVTPASGQTLTIANGAATATIVTVGASLASYRDHDRDLVVPFDPAEIRPDFRGATIAPWPNRIPDGSYFFGDEQQLPITEPDRGHAIHGLASWLDWAVTVHSQTAVTLTTQLVPQPGYPWRVALTSEFRLSDAGLTQTLTARNLSDTAAPFGAAPHPYLVAPEGKLHTWTLSLPAATVLLTDDRLAPRARAAVEHDGDRFDFRQPRRIGAAAIDHAFTDLARDAAGISRVRVTDATGRGAELSFDERCPWVQVYTADHPVRTRNRIGVAVEPMTCPPAAFQTGEDVISLEPGRDVTVAWTLAPVQPAT